MKLQPDSALSANRPVQWDGKPASLPGILLDATPFMIWVKDVDGRYVFINEAYRQFFSVNVDKRLGLTDWEVYPPALASRYRSEDEQVCRPIGPVDSPKGQNPVEVSFLPPAW